MKTHTRFGARINPPLRGLKAAPSAAPSPRRERAAALCSLWPYFLASGRAQENQAEGFSLGAFFPKKESASIQKESRTKGGPWSEKKKSNSDECRAIAQILVSPNPLP
jgi:hypothetical protein